ncbi:MAG: hypothetical protein M3083_09795 [Actinomycetota bacterium]|nr:hypothetical protein [Actinomycetota bacterium]
MTGLPCPQAVRDILGFGKLTATDTGGRSIFNLYALDIGEYLITPAKDDVAIAAQTKTSTELALFDTDRDRLHGHLFVPAASVDDPSSLPSQVLAALAHITLPAKLAGMPDPVTAVLSHSGPIVHAVRKATHHESDYHLRVARLRVALEDGVVARIVLPRQDRPLKPRAPNTSLHSSLSAVAPFNEFGQNLQVLVDDVRAEVQVLKVSQDWNRLGASDRARTELLVEATLTRLVRDALSEFANRYPVPLVIRQLRFERGPKQLLARVSLGEDP